VGGISNRRTVSSLIFGLLTYARVLLLPPFSNLADAVQAVNPLGLSLSSFLT
jgi:hypothetical protein